MLVQIFIELWTIKIYFTSAYYFCLLTWPKASYFSWLVLAAQEDMMHALNWNTFIYFEPRTVILSRELLDRIHIFSLIWCNITFLAFPYIAVQTSWNTNVRKKRWIVCVCACVRACVRVCVRMCEGCLCEIKRAGQSKFAEGHEWK